MTNPRTFRRYQGRVGREIVHGGISERLLDERQEELNRKYPGIKLTQVGPAVTEQTARDWEKEKGYS